MKWVPSSSIQEDAEIQILEEAKRRIAADPCSIVERAFKGTHLVHVIDIGKAVYVHISHLHIYIYICIFTSANRKK